MNLNQQLTLLYKEHGWPSRHPEDKLVWHERMDGSELAKMAGAMAFKPYRVVNNWYYLVQISKAQSAWGEIEHMQIRRNDANAHIGWAVMQRIKNELIGPDRIAVEVYPKQDQVIDQANIYHLWVLPEGFELPFGIHKGATYG